MLRGGVTHKLKDVVRGDAGDHIIDIAGEIAEGSVDRQPRDLAALRVHRIDVALEPELLHRPHVVVPGVSGLADAPTTATEFG